MNKITKKGREAMRKGGRKGGKAKVPKGFAMMDKKRYKEFRRVKNDLSHLRSDNPTSA